MITKPTGKANHPHDKTRPLPAAIKKALAADDIAALTKALSVRQRRFAEEYVIDFNATAAAVRSGYATTYADRQAYILTHHDGVVKYIDHLTRSKEAKIMSIDPDYVLSKVTEIISKLDAKDSDKLRGLELLARHLGMFVDRTEISGKDGGPIQTQEVQEDADALESAISKLAERRGTTAH